MASTGKERQAKAPRSGGINGLESGSSLWQLETAVSCFGFVLIQKKADIIFEGTRIFRVTSMSKKPR